MAMRSVYNFHNDPYYRDLYQAPNRVLQITEAFNQAQRMQAEQVKTRVAEKELEKLERSLDAENDLAEWFRDHSFNPNDDSFSPSVSREDVYAMMEKTALDSGNVEGYLKIAKSRESESAAEDRQNWEVVERLKKVSPAMAEDHYNRTLARKYGQVAPGEFEEKPKMRLEDGQIFFVDENKMTVTPGGRYAPSSRGSEKVPFDPEYYVSPDGKDVKPINAKDPKNMNVVADLIAQGYKKHGAKEQGGSLRDMLEEDEVVPNYSPVPNASPIPRVKTRKLVF
jgi:hypothetical protein